jgi:quinoprotein glucose dehydrogenase
MTRGDGARRAPAIGGRGRRNGAALGAAALALAAVLAGRLDAQNGNRPSTVRGEWPTYGADLSSSRYSPLDQITAANFSTLALAWRSRSPDAFLSMTLPGGAEWSADARSVFAELTRLDPKRWRDQQPPIVANFKATPLMINGTLYFNTPLSIGAAVDAQTGATKWIYNPRSYEAGTTSMSLRWNQRGVAYWSDGKDERVFWGTGDGYLIAVDAKSGRPIADFGVKGRVDLMEGLPRATRGARDYLNALTYSVQSPPIVIGDAIIAPASISSLVIAKEQIPGWIRAYDVRSGKLRWTFKTVPSPGEAGNETWKEDSWSYAGKVTVWTAMSADETLGHVYLPTNTTAPDYYGGHRLGDNLFAESILCLDVKTGRRVWHFQTVHHGLWDYDNPAAANLLDISVGGRPIKALAQITKQGFTFVLDRVTGNPVWPIEERAVPASDVPGEIASKTQPVPAKPLPFEAQGVSENDLIDFTPELRAQALEAVKGFKLGPLYTPPSIEGTVQRPGAVGGANWGGAAVDPETGILYVPSRNAFAVARVGPPDPALKSNLRYLQTPARNLQMPGGLPLFKPPYSRMTAIDLNTGEHVWMVATGAGERVRSNPALKGLDLPPLGGDITFSGPLLTKTILIYALTAGGSRGGPRLVAYDKANGKELAAVDLPGAAIGTPMTYLVDGKQYIALTVQGARQGEAPELIALALR